ncbi:MAG TPA: DUF3592 domain-containing protein [Parafilimonas sp.]|nr:DUF3592 domain-containing protein [Parafilimonas sp.]
MFRAIIPFYIICLGLYIFFTRQPDYQDGEFTTGIIRYIKDSTGKPAAKAIFSAGRNQDTIAAGYSFRHLKEGQTVKIIYETSDPSKAAVYSWCGYWLQWDELLASFLIPLFLFYAAKAITAGPTPEAVVEELEMQKPPEPGKYD